MLLFLGENTEIFFLLHSNFFTLSQPLRARTHFFHICVVCDENTKKFFLNLPYLSLFSAILKNKNS
jgi:hypothetical protein